MVVAEVEKTDDEQCKRVCELYKRFLDACYEVRDKISGEGFSADLKEYFVMRAAANVEDLSIALFSKFPSVQEYCEMVIDDEELVLDDEMAYPQPTALSDYMLFEEQPFLTYNGFRG